jgi:hypothetical protein
MQDKGMMMTAKIGLAPFIFLYGWHLYSAVTVHGFPFCINTIWCISPQLTVSFVLLVTIFYKLFSVICTANLIYCTVPKNTFN